MSRARRRGPRDEPDVHAAHRYGGEPPVSHLDLYRVDGLSDADWAALAPYFDGAIVFVEWPERARARLPPFRVRVTLAHAGDGAREITVESDEDALLAGLR